MGSIADGFSKITTAVVEDTTEDVVVETQEEQIPENVAQVPPVIKEDNDWFDYANKDKVPVTQTTQVETQEEESSEALDAIKDFAESLGYTGEYEGDSLETLKSIAQNVIEGYKGKAEVFEKLPILNDLVQHLELGGSLQDFISQPQETNHYQGIELEEDNVEDREQLFRIYFNGKVDSEEELQVLIDNAKEKGVFTQRSNQILEKLAEQEAAQNAQIKATRDQEIQQAIEDNKKFVSEVATTFEKGLQGISVDKSIVDKAKAGSLPDQRGAYGIQEVFSKFGAKEQAVMNIFATALAEGKRFEYNPTKGAVTNIKDKPIIGVLNKTGTAPAGQGSKLIKDINSINNLFPKRK